MRKVFFLLMLFFTYLGLNAQNHDYDFIYQRTSYDGIYTYFDVVGLQDADDVELIIDELLLSDNVFDVSFYKSTYKTDRFLLLHTGNVEANMVRNILLKYNIDFHPSSVSIDGQNPQDLESSSAKSGFQSVSNGIKTEHFSEDGTTNNVEDYTQKKNKWIEEYPEEYKRELERNDNVNKSE